MLKNCSHPENLLFPDRDQVAAELPDPGASAESIKQHRNSPTPMTSDKRTVYPVAQPGGAAAGSQPAKRNMPSQENLPYARERALRTGT